MVAISSWMMNYFYPEVKSVNQEDFSLHHAVNRRKIEDVDALIAAGHSPLKTDIFNYNPVDYAAFRQDKESLLHLLAPEPSRVEEARKVLDHSGWMSLNKTIEFVDSVKLLLSHKKVKDVIPLFAKFREDYQKLSTEIKNLELLVKKEKQASNAIASDTEDSKGKLPLTESFLNFDQFNTGDLDRAKGTLSADSLKERDHAFTLSTNERPIGVADFNDSEVKIDLEGFESINGSVAAKQEQKSDYSQKLLDLLDRQLNLGREYTALLNTIGNDLLLCFIAELPKEEVIFLLEKRPELLTASNRDNFNIFHFVALNPSQEVILEVLKHAKEIPSSSLCKVSPLEILMFEAQKKDPLQLEPFQCCTFLADWVPKFAVAIGAVLPASILAEITNFNYIKDINKGVNDAFAIFGLFKYVSILQAIKMAFQGNVKKACFTLAYLTLSFIPFFNILPKAYLIYLFAKDTYFGIKKSVSQIEGRPYRFLINNSIRVLNTALISYDAVSKLASMIQVVVNQKDIFLEFGRSFIEVLVNIRNTVSFADNSILDTYISSFERWLFSNLNLAQRLAEIDEEMKRNNNQFGLKQALSLSQLDLKSGTLKKDIGKFRRSCGAYHPDKPAYRSASTSTQELYMRYITYCSNAVDAIRKTYLSSSEDSGLPTDEDPEVDLDKLFDDLMNSDL
jgi:hypothetical protein